MQMWVARRGLYLARSQVRAGTQRECRQNDYLNRAHGATVQFPDMRWAGRENGLGRREREREGGNIRREEIERKGMLEEKRKRERERERERASAKEREIDQCALFLIHQPCLFA